MAILSQPARPQILAHGLDGKSSACAFQITTGHKNWTVSSQDTASLLQPFMFPPPSTMHAYRPLRYLDLPPTLPSPTDLFALPNSNPRNFPVWRGDFGVCPWYGCGRENTKSWAGGLIPSMVSQMIDRLLDELG